MLFKHLIFYAAFARLFEDSLYLHLSVFSPLAVIPFIIYASMGEDYMAVNALSYLGSVIPLYSTCILFYNFQINVEGFQFLSEYYLLDLYINTSNSLGLDGLSFFFFALTALIFPFCIMSSLQTTHVKKSAYYVASLLALESILLLAFSTTDLFVFYVAFEAVLIPMFFIIGVLGSGRSRVKAAYYFFFYTLIGSIFFSLGIFTIYLHIGSTSFLEILNAPKLPWDVEILLFFTLGLGFSVKMPLFPFHT